MVCLGLHSVQRIGVVVRESNIGVCYVLEVRLASDRDRARASTHTRTPSVKDMVKPDNAHSSTQSLGA